MDNGKTDRTLGIYAKLIGGYGVSKSEEAKHYGVNERTIQRDIDDIRYFLEKDADNNGFINNVVYDRKDKVYRLERLYRNKFTNSEILAICKILLDSRALTKEEMYNILDKLVDECVPKKNQKVVSELIRNEKFYYVEPRHKTKFIDKMWDIGQAINENHYIEIDYVRMKDKSIVTRKLRPVSIMFSEYYFYLAAFIDDEKIQEHFDVKNDAFPTIYRIDRIKRLSVFDEKFFIPYNDRFQEGEFRKRVQFMYGGKLQKVTFKFSGTDIDSVLDRLPTARIIHEENGVYTITAEVFGKGIDMWLRSQGDNVEII
ncbi:MAG: helix-turn-helix transcriptional regulator [Acutalibacteraceae bacterium]